MWNSKDKITSYVERKHVSVIGQKRKQVSVIPKVKFDKLEQIWKESWWKP
jgi:hypothetical protein